MSTFAEEVWKQRASLDSSIHPADERGNRIAKTYFIAGARWALEQAAKTCAAKNCAPEPDYDPSHWNQAVDSCTADIVKLARDLDSPKEPRT